MVRNAACPVDSGGLCLRPSAGSAITDGICGTGFGSGAQMRRDRRRPSAPGRSQAGAHWSGASETKPCVSDGTSGRFTGSPEYELNLAVALKLQELLEQRGYRVVMTRTDNDVNLSNRARAELAAREGGDIFVRIHANGWKIQPLTAP